MKKLESLRAHLLDNVEQLKKDPAKLEVFVDKGDVAVRAGSLSFEYGYTASVWVQDFAGSADDLLVPILAWIAAYQPELFEAGERKPFSFEAELLDAETYDITVSIALTERVRVEQRPDGLQVTHLPEPDLADAYAGVPTGTTLWAGLIGPTNGTIERVEHP